MQDPGLDLHEWESQWQQLEPLVEESPIEALPELDRLVRRMLAESGYPVDDIGAAIIDEIEVLAEYREAHRIARAVDRGETIDPGDVGAAVLAFQAIHQHVLSLKTGF